MKVLIAGGGTGGHLMPALALADALHALRPDVEPLLVGAERGVEARLLPQRDHYPFHLLPAEPIYRRSWWKNAKWFVILPRLLRACRRILDAERPAFAVGTGGYAAGPMLWACSQRGIPFGLQEQNAVPGVTTRLLARRARQIHLGYPEARHRLRAGRDTEVFELGNPITPPDPAVDRPSTRRDLGIAPDQSVCFVMGGSQGASAVNRTIAGALDAGALDGVTVLWSTGPAMWEAYRRYDAAPHCIVRPFWDPVAEAYAAADMVVSRAGAMTTAELSAWGLPAVLIPLPTAAADHQTRNAEALARAGSAVHLPEARLEPARLATTIRELLGSSERLRSMSQVAIERSHPHAAKLIAERLLTLAQ
jgi:UDP-N-acetylglucosamine--N-acetylmuramyl-(pentapeptide) pyrophosphoryl-undecaprenol N-acetylglucosamine transferase